MGPLSQGFQAMRSTPHPRISDAQRNRQVPPFSVVLQSFRNFQNVTDLVRGRGGTGLVSRLSLSVEGGGGAAIIIFKGLLVQQQSLSLVPANEKLLAGFHVIPLHLLCCLRPGAEFI